MTVDLARPLARRVLGPEVLLVLGLSLGQSAIYSVVTITARLTAARPLSQQTAALNASQSPRPWLDLTYQLLGIFFALVPVLLAVHLLNRDRILDRLSDRPLDRDGLLARDALPDQGPDGGRDVLPDQGPGGAREALGLDVRRPGRDLAWGAALAAAIGLPGLGLLWIAAQLGVNATVVPASLPALWWTVPVLVLSAAQNAILEEVVVVGYLLTRLRQLGWRIGAVIAASALLRGSYHLYQGFGAFVGNAVMGVVFALFFLRTKRVLPLVVAHTLLDVVAFVGYALLPRDWFDWL
ncbi:CPBP family intramembrane metalloprotease [Micromonospora sp. WMMD1102]|uniref:CPBP family intramembrane glutamic endopeptidase n=1 Tax=Micromonospora sp. WMMD1102 TaxID=3016105 RepID=UPI002415166F|nr:CPBP family intramembrane glutamic endopeptidase [Micromonospora sp. WMMD1102]MDG4791108.1 CPBP family intramembrane metalloprotease [Micromonospora sp. WMMD1102]